MDTRSPAAPRRGGTKDAIALLAAAVLIVASLLCLIGVYFSRGAPAATTVAPAAASAAERATRASALASELQSRGLALAVSASGPGLTTLQLSAPNCRRPMIDALLSEPASAQRLQSLGFVRVDCLDTVTAQSTTVSVAERLVEADAANQAALRNYIITTAVDLPRAAQALSESTSGCIEEPSEGAPTTAVGSADCLRRARDTQSLRIARLRAAPTNAWLAPRHGELVALAEANLAALTRFAAEMERLAPTLDRQRGRHRWSEWWGEQETPEDEAAYNASRGDTELQQRWLAWIHALNPVCNRMLRCVQAERIPVNCIWARVAGIATGENSHTRAFLASESTLPPFQGGIE
jgi:hypothetical protein